MTGVVQTVVDGLALAVAVAGILAAAGVAVLAGLRVGVAVLLDFLLAAGLLRLSSGLGWEAIGTIALIVAIRQLISRSLRAGPRDERTVRPPRPPARRTRAGAGR